MSPAASNLLIDLAHLLESGVAPVDAVSRLDGRSHDEQQLCAVLQAELTRGRPLATAIAQTGIASRLEVEILKVAEQAGKLGDALRVTADHIEQRLRRRASLKARLWMPNALLVGVLVFSVVQTMTAGGSFVAALRSIIPVVVVAGGVSWMMLRGAARDRTGWLETGWRFGLIPRVSLLRRFHEQTFFHLLTWQMEAGVDPVSGSRVLGRLIKSGGFERAVTAYRQLLSGGATMSDALTRTKLLETGELAQVITSGEQAGRLSESLRHYFVLEDARLDVITTGFFTWMPRAYYFAVVIVGALAVI